MSAGARESPVCNQIISPIGDSSSRHFRWRKGNLVPISKGSEKTLRIAAVENTPLSLKRSEVETHSLVTFWRKNHEVQREICEKLAASL
jgi:hypothetical protein